MEDGTGTVLHMTVEIGDGRQDVLQITLADDPQSLADRFSFKHKLPREMTEKLKFLIAHNQSALRKYQIHTLSVQPSRSLSPSHHPPARSISGYAEAMQARVLAAKRPPSAQVVTPVKPKSLHPAHNPDLLLQKGRAAEDRLKETRTHYLAEELKDCTFRPQLDHRSQKLSSRSQAALPRHEKLYQDAKLRSEQQKETYLYTVKTEFPYHPQVAGRRESGETREQVFARLTQAKRQISTEQFGEEGQSQSEASENAFFHPLTGRGPSIPEYIRKQPVHEHLYQLRSHKEKVSEELRAKLDEDRHFSGPFTTKRSEILLRQVWRRQLEKIFRALDGDRDGILTFDTLTTTDIEERALLLLSPIWEEMRDRGVEYELDTFVTDAEAVIGTMSIEEKDYLMKASLTQAVEVQQLQRQPVLSPVSKMLAATRFDDVDIYTKQVQGQEQTAEKLAKLKASLREQELAECTFHPETTKYVRR